MAHKPIEHSQQGADARQRQRTNRAAFALLWEYVYQDRGVLLQASAWLMAAAGLSVLGPVLGKIFIDQHLVPRAMHFWPLLGLFGLFVFSQALAAWINFRQQMVFTRIALGTVGKLRKRVFAHALALPVAWYDQQVTGQLLSRITNDTEAVKQLYLGFLFTLLSNGVMLLGILLAMAFLQWQMMLVALTVVPLSVGTIWLYQRYSTPAVEAVRESRAAINTQLSEAIQGMAVIQACNQTERFAALFDQSNQRQYQARVSTVRISAALLRPAIDFFSMLITAAILFFFASGHAEVGVLYAFIAYLGRFMEPLIEITQQFSQYQQAQVAAARVNALLQEVAAVTQRPLAAKERLAQPQGPGALHLNAVSFAYQPQQPILSEVSFSLPQGGFLGIVGRTGSGKTTLFNLLLGFYPPSQGQILLNELPLAAWDQGLLRSQVAWVPQEPYLYAATVRDNIDCHRGYDDQRLLSACERAQFDGVLARLPQGLDTVLGERGSELSSGERQLLAMARALAGEPWLLLLDEATANIDSGTERLLQRALSSLRGQVSVVAIAHRLSTLREADEILVLDGGRVVERGDHSGLMRRSGLYANFVNGEPLLWAK